jgi:hypothetical protein
VTPRARVTTWTADGVRLESYTCPVAEAHERALADVAGDGGTGYATIAHLDGSMCYRVPERDGVAPTPSGPRFLVLDPDGTIRPTG